MSEAKALREQILQLVSDGRNFNARTVANVLRSRQIAASRNNVDREIKNLRAQGRIVPTGDCLYPDGRPGWFTLAPKGEADHD